MKRHILLVIAITSLLASQNSVHAYPLSPQSKKFMQLAAVIGGSVGGLIGGLAYANTRIPLQEKDKNFWEKFKDLSSYILFPAAAGAAIIGGGSYFFTSEYCLDWEQINLTNIENNPDFQAAMAGGDSAVLKKYRGNRFPTIPAYEKLTKLYNSLLSVNKRFWDLAHSGIPLVQTIAKSCLEKIKGYEETLSTVLVQLKDQYLAESNVHAMQRMATAQIESAHAQSQIAHAALIKALSPKPQPVIVISK